MWEYNNYAELFHHGILGQKWGVRRFQNYDGSLTDAGRTRLQRDQTKLDNAQHTYNRYRKRKKTAKRLSIMLGPVGVVSWYSSPTAIKDAAMKKIYEKRVDRILERMNEKYYVLYNERTKRYELYDTDLGSFESSN